MARGRKGNGRDTSANTRTSWFAFTRNDVLVIVHHRFRSATLPDTAEGRRFLYALIGLRLPVAQAFDLAPWCRDGDLRATCQRVASDRRPFTRDRVGNLIELAFDEIKRIKREHGHSIRHIAPFNAQKWEVQEFWKEVEREADRERKGRERQRKREMATAPKVSPRARLVRDAVLVTQWTSVTEITAAVGPSLRDRQGRRLEERATRAAVVRALDELVRAGRVETKIEPGEHGMPTRYARRTLPSRRDHVSDHENVSGHVEQP